jgi:hypothetical protein
VAARARLVGPPRCRALSDARGDGAEPRSRSRSASSAPPPPQVRAPTAPAAGARRRPGEGPPLVASGISTQTAIDFAVSAQALVIFAGAAVLIFAALWHSGEQISARPSFLAEPPNRPHENRRCYAPARGRAPFDSRPACDRGEPARVRGRAVYLMRRREPGERTRTSSRSARRCSLRRQRSACCSSPTIAAHPMSSTTCGASRSQSCSRPGCARAAAEGPPRVVYQAPPRSQRTLDPRLHDRS